MYVRSLESLKSFLAAMANSVKTVRYVSIKSERERKKKMYDLANL